MKKILAYKNRFITFPTLRFGFSCENIYEVLLPPALFRTVIRLRRVEGKRKEKKKKKDKKGSSGLTSPILLSSSSKLEGGTLRGNL
jgi:hypothetical protein